MRGHAYHFRVRIPEADGIRIDIISVMHGCDPFDQLWRRRRQVGLPDVGRVNVLGLVDLVRAKKTQRDKDWPMVGRLVEVDFNRRPRRPSQSQIRFWLQEARSAELLVELCDYYPAISREVAMERPAVYVARTCDLVQVAWSLRVEEDICRARDRAYWQPLRAGLFKWRRDQRQTR